MKTAAIVLAAGKGSRMQSKVHKQYLELAGSLLIFYSLYEMEQAVDEIILVLGAGEEEF